MPFNVPILELDITGTNVNNRIVDEPHTLSNNQVRSIAPNYGPFFSESVVVKDGVNTLTRGLEYQIVELHQEATLKYGKEISSVILIIDQNVSSNITITYQALGGHYTFSDTAIANLYQSVITDNRPVPWESIINRPNEFSPSIHRHLIEDVYGFETVVDYLERIKRAITLGQTSVVIEIVNSLLSKFKQGELPKVLPNNKILEYDALLYFLSRRKILNDIWVDISDSEWLKGGSYSVEVDTSGYPIGRTLYWEFYKPDMSITLFNPKSGEIIANGGIQRFTIYVPSEPSATEVPLYIGIKENPNDEEYVAVTYIINLVENTSTQEYMYLLLNDSVDGTMGTVNNCRFGQDYDTYLYFRTAIT